LEQKIKKKEIKVGIIGLGYVGLPLGVFFAKKGFKVIGFDIKEERIKWVNEGKSYIGDVKEGELKEVVKKKRIEATKEYEHLKECEVLQICVPTPVNKNKEPIIDYVVNTTKEIAKHLKREQLIILKSTTFPETTVKVVLPLLSISNLKVGEDFFLAFSPERIDPGNKKYTLENTPTVVGGVTSSCTKLASILYRTAGIEVVEVSSPTVAEMSKLLENTFRNVNIALVNEFLQLCERMEIDVWEVIQAASTKPFGYMPFYPGPGVGGHCIPIDPYYLSWKAKEYDFHPMFIEVAAKVNEGMPYYIVNKVIETLSEAGVCPSKAKVLMLGVSFKKDVEDIRNSPAIKVMEILQKKVKKVMFNDPYVNKVEVGGKVYNCIDLSEENLKKVDCVVITTDHSLYDYEMIKNFSPLIVDTRNALRRGSINLNDL